MHRIAEEHLVAWKSKAGRKPIVLRGARQVGKSYLVREFARENFKRFVEINFERDPDIATLFTSNSPSKIVQLLELRLDTAIRPGETLLFLDEIQAAPSTIAALRYFLEQMPELHVAAAGSLLEMVLSDLPRAMPVGRIEYLHLGPMQFEEFLRAAGHERLVGFLGGLAPGEEVPEAIHAKLLDLFRTFVVVGGMPEAVAAYLVRNNFREAEEVKHSILSTYKEDFGKYAGRVPHTRLHSLFGRIPALIGRGFKYAHVDRAEPARALARALDLLCMARVASRVRHSSANGVPLGAEANDRIFKLLFLDAGLVTTATGLTILDFEQAADILLVNSGATCEQAVGQHLLHSAPPYHEPELFFWVREKANAAAEVDYLVAEGAHVVPVEVKAGKTGTLKSLHLFLREKRRSLGVRLNSGPPSLLRAETALADGKKVPFRLLSLPLYMVGQVRRLIRETLAGEGGGERGEGRGGRGDPTYR
ncbi:MAG: ATP-binding protein [Deltaproteobacteria bacterium]|nr:ATP-binding protein [Deltaproteobacteria bacterium]